MPRHGLSRTWRPAKSMPALTNRHSAAN